LAQTVKCQAVEASAGAVWEHSPERVVADRTTIGIGESAHSPFVWEHTQAGVMHHIPGKITVDHCNLNRLDCCKYNLRLVDTRTQVINRRITANKRTGITDLHEDIALGR